MPPKVTNNVAEYNSLILGLQLAAQQNITSLHIRGDSNLIISQLKGTAQVSSPNLQPLYSKTKALLAKLTNYLLEHVSREHPLQKLVDALANKAIDDFLHTSSHSSHAQPPRITPIITIPITNITNLIPNQITQHFQQTTTTPNHIQCRSCHKSMPSILKLVDHLNSRLHSSNGF
jgi:hypothetical protein